MKGIFSFCLLLCLSTFLNGQCDPIFDPPLSDRLANYWMKVDYDHQTQSIKAEAKILWINSSPDTIEEVPFYMYLNAFKNVNSTYLAGIGNFFNDPIYRRKDGEWGWIEVDQIWQNEQDISDTRRYIQTDDDNRQDQSVLQIRLAEPVMPFDSLHLKLNFEARLPKTIVRSGYSKDDWALFVHWFPQVGVYEQNPSGQWGWNCHQFHRSTEFYSDFGLYDVEIKAADHLVMGASGCLIDEQKHEDGTISRHYLAEDVIDFAWVAYPYFEEYIEQWNQVNIRLLIPPEHCMLVERYMDAMKASLSYLHDHVGPYPYPMITVVDPPIHALRSGFMEYPTLITTGSFYRMPAGIRTVESLAAHEFSHQYFMGMLASNEKEEAWLDEGFVTYFEDRIIDDHYGEKKSLIQLAGYQLDNQQKSRNEYASLSNPKISSGARPGWEIPQDFKGLIYAKTATTLRTLEGMVGMETMDEIIKTYFQRWKFKHPRGRDFIAVANEVVQENHGDRFGPDLNWFFDQCIYNSEVCDYSLASISNGQRYVDHGYFDTESGEKVFQMGHWEDTIYSAVTIHRLGELILPVEIAVYFKDGTKKLEYWDGAERYHTFEYKGFNPVIAAQVDPEYKIYLDIDFNNNSKTLQPNKSALWKYMAKATFWAQQIFQTVGFLF